MNDSPGDHSRTPLLLAVIAVISWGVANANLLNLHALPALQTFIIQYGMMSILFIAFYFPDRLSQDLCLKTTGIIAICSAIENGLFYYEVQILPPEHFTLIVDSWPILLYLYYTIKLKQKTNFHLALPLVGITLLWLTQKPIWAHHLNIHYFLGFICPIAWSIQCILLGKDSKLSHMKEFTMGTCLAFIIISISFLIIRQPIVKVSVFELKALVLTAVLYFCGYVSWFKALKSPKKLVVSQIGYLIPLVFLTVVSTLSNHRVPYNYFLLAGLLVVLCWYLSRKTPYEE